MSRSKIFAALAAVALLTVGALAVRAQKSAVKLWEVATGQVIQSSPAVASDGTIYVGCDNGRLYSVTSDGKVRWFFPTGGALIATPAIGPDGTIYAASSDGCLYALDAEGTEKFRLATGDAITGSPAVGVDGTVYFGTVQSNLFAVFPDGRAAWGLHAGGSVVSSPAIAEDGTIYVGLLNGKLLAVHSAGLKKWEFTAGGKINSSPAVGVDGTIYFGAHDGLVYALSPAGKKLWTYKTAAPVRSSPALGSDGTVYIGSDDRKLHAIRTDGTRKWTFETGNWVRSSPAVGADGSVFFGSYDGKFYAAGPDGSSRWFVETGSHITSSPTLAPDGTIYIGSWDKNLYAFRNDERLAASTWPKFRGPLADRPGLAVMPGSPLKPLAKPLAPVIGEPGAKAADAALKFDKEPAPAVGSEPKISSGNPAVTTPGTPLPKIGSLTPPPKTAPVSTQQVSVQFPVLVRPPAPQPAPVIAPSTQTPGTIATEGTPPVRANPNLSGTRPDVTVPDGPLPMITPGVKPALPQPAPPAPQLTVQIPQAAKTTPAVVSPVTVPQLTVATSPAPAPVVSVNPNVSSARPDVTPVALPTTVVAVVPPVTPPAPRSVPTPPTAPGSVVSAVVSVTLDGQVIEAVRTEVPAPAPAPAPVPVPMPAPIVTVSPQSAPTVGVAAPPTIGATTTVGSSKPAVTAPESTPTVAPRTVVTPPPTVVAPTPPTVVAPTPPTVVQAPPPAPAPAPTPQPAPVAAVKASPAFPQSTEKRLLIVDTNGVGRVLPDTGGMLWISVGQTFTLVAEPGLGYRFASWTGGLNASTPVLNFEMKSNLVLTANFVPIDPSAAITSVPPMVRPLPAPEPVPVPAPTPPPAPAPAPVAAAPSPSPIVSLANVQPTTQPSPIPLARPPTVAPPSPPPTLAPAPVVAAVPTQPAPPVQPPPAPAPAPAPTPKATQDWHMVLITLEVNGGGSISPNWSGRLLEAGKNYTFTAEASRGQVFTSWTGDMQSSNPKLTFAPRANTRLVANFAPAGDSARAVTPAPTPAPAPTPTAAVTPAPFPSPPPVVEPAPIVAANPPLATAQGVLPVPGAKSAPVLPAETATKSAPAATPATSAAVKTSKMPHWMQRLLYINPPYKQDEAIRAAQAAGTAPDVTATAAPAGKSLPEAPMGLFALAIAGGGGRVVPIGASQFLEVGRAYTVTAVPENGFEFTGWSGDIETNSASLNFVMRTTLALQANFRAATTIATVPPVVAPPSIAVPPNLTVPPPFIPAPAPTGTATQDMRLPSGLALRPQLPPTARLILETNGMGRIFPNYGGLMLDVGRVYTMAAEPAPGWEFAGWSGSASSPAPRVQFQMESNLLFRANFVPAPDRVRPVIAIASPASGERVKEGFVTVQGTADDDTGVARVEIQSGSGEFRLAEGTTNWAARIVATPGTNTVVVRAFDAAGNESVAVSRSFVFGQYSQFTMRIIGQGRVMPDLGGKFLEVGGTYTLTAEAYPGWQFAGWVDGINPDKPSLSFVMQPDLLLEARFEAKPAPPTLTPVPPPPPVVAAKAPETTTAIAPRMLTPAPVEPAPPVISTTSLARWQGRYNGLFYDTNALAPHTAGYFVLVVYASGTFSGRLDLGELSLPLSGQLDEQGRGQQAFQAQGRSRLRAQFAIDAAAQRITGQLQDDTFAATMFGDRQGFETTTRRSPLAGSYTLVIPGLTNGVSPSGDGFGTLAVDGLGRLAFRGELADGTLLSQDAFLSKDGVWPLHVPLYKGRGALMGWVTLTNNASLDLFGQAHWFKPPTATDPYYPGGFSSRVFVFGSAYSPPESSAVAGKLTGLMRGGNLGEQVMEDIALGVDNRPPAVKSNSGFLLTLASGSGTLAGNFTHPATRRATPFRGVLLQRQNWASGYFLGTNQSGMVFLRAQGE